MCGPSLCPFFLSLLDGKFTLFYTFSTNIICYCQNETQCCQPSVKNTENSVIPLLKLDTYVIRNLGGNRVKPPYFQFAPLETSVFSLDTQICPQMLNLDL